MSAKTNGFPFTVHAINALQDTTRQVNKSFPSIQLSNPLNQSDTVDKTFLLSTPLNKSSIDSIFKKHEERELQYQQEIRLQQAKRWTTPIDTSKLLYENLGFYNKQLFKNFSEDQFQQNFLFNIPTIKVEEKNKYSQVFIYTQKESKNQKFIDNYFPIKSSTESKIIFDWISLVVFLSIVLLGWIRLFFNKYFLMIIKSTISYQESTALFREKNTVVERVFFLLGILFILSASIFALQLSHFFSFGFNENQYNVFFIAFIGSLMGLYLFRLISSAIIGSLFLKQKVFSEYMHNVNIYTMNTGIILLPVIIILQYLSFEYLKFIVYFGIASIVFLYFLQVLRSFQIINRKNVSIFYMILYLCAFEFAPFLIVYKLLLSLN